MSKKAKIFANIVYYVFTIGLGIVLAFVLPGILMTANLPRHVEKYLAEGKYAESINLLINYDDKEYVYQEDSDSGCGIVLFSTLVSVDNTEDDATQDDRCVKSYSGFLYNASDYTTYRLLNNKTKIVVNMGEADEVKVNLLNQDSDDDGLYDNVLSKAECTYVYFDILNEITTDIRTISFMDAEGEIYASYTVHLDFSEKFFSDLDDFIAEYNSNSSSDKLSDLEEEFLAKDSDYEKCSYQNEKLLANREGAWIILVYFVAIYLIADFTVGMHYILHFIKWIIRKIRKKNPVPDKVDEQKENIGDYYTMVTMHFDVPSDCNINFTVSYHNENDAIELILSKDKDYTATERIHAGIYPNAYLVSPGYVSENLPEPLIVRGYTMNVEVKIRKADNDSENIKKE